jgi:predicted Zn-dependent peptidase
LYQKTTLGNGLRVLTTNMSHTRSVSVCFYIGVGSRYESDLRAGSCHFIEHMLFKGTEKRTTSREISEAIEGVGGILNAFTDREMTGFWCKVARPHFNIALDVLTDMLLRSCFDVCEIEKERRVIIEEINMANDDPPQRVNTMMDELLWPGQPLGRDIAGSKDAVKAATRSGLISFMKSNYIPENMVVSIAGNIKHDKAVDAVAEIMGDWKSKRKQNRFKPFKERLGKRVNIEKRKLEQVHLSLALPGVSLIDERRFTLSLLNVILGQGMSSRLFTEVRDKLGLAYNIFSHADTLMDTGSFSVYAGVVTTKMDVAIATIVGELKKLKSKPVSKAELAKVKEASKGRLLLKMEDSRSVAGWVGGQEMLSGKVMSVDDVIGRLNEVTVEDIQKLAGELFSGDKLRLAVVGPVDEGKDLNYLVQL